MGHDSGATTKKEVPEASGGSSLRLWSMGHACSPGAPIPMLPVSKLKSAFWKGGDRSTMAGGASGKRHTISAGRLRVVVKDPGGGDLGGDDATPSQGRLYHPLLLRTGLPFYTAGKQANRPTNEAEPDPSSVSRRAMMRMKQKSAELWERRGRSAGGPGGVRDAWDEIKALSGHPGLLTDDVREAMGMWAFDSLLHIAKTVPSQELRFFSKSTAAESPTVRGAMRELVNVITIAANPLSGEPTPAQIRAGALPQMTKRITDIALAALSAIAYHVHMTDAMAASSAGLRDGDKTPRSARWILVPHMKKAIVALFGMAVNECGAEVMKKDIHPILDADDVLHPRLDIVLDMEKIQARATSLAEEILDRCVKAASSADYAAHLHDWGQAIASASPPTDSLSEMLAAVESYACAKLVAAHASTRLTADDVFNTSREASAAVGPPSALTPGTDAVSWRDFNAVSHLTSGIADTEKALPDGIFTFGLLDTFYSILAMRSAAAVWANADLWHDSGFTLLISDAYRIGGLEKVAARIMTPVSKEFTDSATQRAIFVDWCAVHGLLGSVDDLSYDKVAMSSNSASLEDLTKASHGPVSAVGGLLGRALAAAPAMFFFGAPVPETVIVTGRLSSAFFTTGRADLDTISAYKAITLGPTTMGTAVRGDSSRMGSLPFLDGPSLHQLLSSVMESFRALAAGLSPSEETALFTIATSPGRLGHTPTAGGRPEYYTSPGGTSGDPFPSPSDQFTPDGDGTPVSPTGALSPFTKIVQLAESYLPARIEVTRNDVSPLTTKSSVPFMADVAKIVPGATQFIDPAEDSFLEEGLAAPDAPLVTVRKANAGVFSAYMEILDTAPAAARAAIASLALREAGSRLPLPMPSSALITALSDKLDLANALLAAVRIVTSQLDPMADAAASTFAAEEDMAYAPLPPVMPTAEELAKTPVSELASSGLLMARPLFVIDNPTSDDGDDYPSAEVISADQHAAYLSAISQALVAAVRFRVATRATPGFRKQGGVADVEDAIDRLLVNITVLRPIAPYISALPSMRAG